MATVFLIIWKPQPDFAQLWVKCSVCMGPKYVSARNRRFSSPRELESALLTAGVTEDESQAALQVFQTGLPTFISVNEDIAKKLGLLE